MKSPTENLKLRGNDPTGHGYYGAKRGTRKHKGLDVVALPKEKIYSPITGFFKRIGQVYSHTKKYNLIEIVNDVYSIKLMYVEPYDFKANEFIAEGQEIGICQDISSYWGGNMTNHIHFEVRKHGLLTDPEPLLKCK